MDTSLQLFKTFLCLYIRNVEFHEDQHFILGN